MLPRRAAITVGLARAASVAAAATLLSTTAFAADLKVDVTGSNIRRVDNETASPVEVITRQDIERTGAVSLSEVLEFIPSAGFAIDDRVTNGFTNGASALNLRNLGFSSTLILLNGRRLPTYPVAQRTFAGVQGFQDLNAIPIETVERIEILKDGLSAIYGADAVGGVVNIIQRNGYVGMEAGASYGTTKAGDGRTYSSSGTLGFGDLSTDRYNVFLSLGYLKRDAMTNANRPYAADEDLRGRGGNDLRSAWGYPGTVVDSVDGTVFAYPSCAPTPVGADYCRYNRAASGGVYPRIERYDISAKAELAATKDLTLFTELMWSRNDSFNLGFPAPSTDDPFIGSNILPVGHPNNPFPHEAFVFHRYADVGNRDADSRGDTYRGVVGAKGSRGAWDWEAYASWNRIDVEERLPNNVLAQSALATIEDRSYDFFNPFANPAATTRLRYEGLHRGESTFRDYGVKASGELWTLPAGPMFAAVGAQYTYNSLRDIPDPQMAAGNVLGFGASAAFGEQALAAVFGEVVFPVAAGLELSAALRYDRYSLSGLFSKTSPKVGMRWQPLRNLLVRATYSEAFRAPSPFETTPAEVTYAESGLIDPVRCVNGDEADCTLDVRVVQRGNSHLKAETSRVWNAGLVWDVTPGASLSADVYRIERNDEIGLFGTQTLINLFPDDPAIVVRSPTGAIVQVNNIPVQFAKTTTSGVDIDARVRAPMRYGTLQARAQVAYVRDFTVTSLSDAGMVEHRQQNGGYDQPGLRGAWDVAWLQGAHQVSVNGYYIHHYGQPTPVDGGGDVAATAIWNLFWKWDVDGNLSLTASVQNLTDRHPPFSNETSGTNAGYNPSQSDPRGRAYRAGVNYRFR